MSYKQEYNVVLIEAKILREQEYKIVLTEVCM